MRKHTLKEVAEAGLLLGFEWIAKNADGKARLYSGGGDHYHHYRFYSGRGGFYYRHDGGWWDGFRNYLVLPEGLELSDYPHAPEDSLLKLSDIGEDSPHTTT